MARIGDVFARVAKAVLNTPSNTFMSALKKDDLYATELSSNFQQIQEQYQYLNFYETLPLKNFNLVSQYFPYIVTLDAHPNTDCRKKLRGPWPT